MTKIAPKKKTVGVWAVQGAVGPMWADRYLARSEQIRQVIKGILDPKFKYVFDDDGEFGGSVINTKTHASFIVTLEGRRFYLYDEPDYNNKWLLNTQGNVIKKV